MNESKAHALSTLLSEKLGDAYVSHVVDRGEVTITVKSAHVQDAMLMLRDTAGCQFEQLVDLAGVDYSTFGQADWITQQATSSGFSRAVGKGQRDDASATASRFAVVYHLLSYALNQRLRVKVMLDENEPMVGSVVDIWPVADWYEREAFDLFGILFQGHPDLRRILTDYGFIGHPFRKDFPLEGYVEVRYDADKKRVVYQPVSIEPRVLVPRVIRDDGRTPGAVH